MKIILIEDDLTVADFIQKGLCKEHHSVDVIHDGQEGLEHATAQDFDILIVDRLLPSLDGLSIVKALRDTGNTSAIIILSALNGVNDKIDGLHAGADDYLAKPFSFGELSARINALSRRPHHIKAETVLEAGDLKLDLIRRRVMKNGNSIKLQPREFALLEYLARRKGQIQTKAMLLEAIWDINFDPLTNVVETHISRLRAKLNGLDQYESIITVRGAGYMIKE
jgi:two-component system OmpR family response regulator